MNNSNYKYSLKIAKNIIYSLKSSTEHSSKIEDSTTLSLGLM